MNVGELLTQLRLELSDPVNTVSPGTTNLSNDALWPDSQLINYLNWAEREFATRIQFYRDVTSTMTQIALVAGQSDYPLDPRILSVLSVQLNAPAGVANLSLWPMSYADMDPGVRTEYNGVLMYPPAALNDTYALPSVTPAPPTPQGWCTDKAANTLTVFPVYNGSWPWTTTAPALNLRVTRLPINPMNPNILTAVPGLPYQYHLALVWGAAWQALLTTDVDGYAPEQAASFQERFEAEILSARRDMIRRMRIKPTIQVGSMGAW
jgi:hypothetical protein